MANELKTVLTNDATQFNQSMDEAEGKVRKFEGKVEDATDAVKDLGDTGKRSTRELIQEAAKLTNAERSVSNYRRQLTQMTKDIQDLTINYRSMSKEMQNSDVGQALLSRINELTLKAGEYKDAIQDSQNAIKAIASDTAAWDAAKQGVTALSSGLQAFAATGMLGKKTTDQLVSALTKLKAIETLTNSAIAIGNALQKDSALLMGISKVQAMALARAKNMETTATGLATVAQKAFNKAANANPYVLLASAIIAIGTALYAFVKQADKAKEAEEQQAAAAERAAEAFNTYKTTVGNAVGNVIAKFDILKRSYQDCTSEIEKREWIEKNKTAFEQLGLSVKSVNDADNIFINQSEDVIQALKDRAEAAALESVYLEAVKKKQQALIEQQKQVKDAEAQDIQTKATGPFLPKEWREAGIKNNSEYVKNTGPVAGSNGMVNSFELTPEGEKKLREYIVNKAKTVSQAAIDEAQKEIDVTGEMMDDLVDKAKESGSKVKQYLTTGGETGGGKEDKQPIEGSLAAAQQKVNELQEKVNNMAVSDPGFAEWKIKLDEAKKELERIKKLVNETDTEEQTKPIVNQIDLLKQYKKELEDEKKYIKYGTEAWYDHLYRINEVDNEIKELENSAKEYIETLNFKPDIPAPAAPDNSPSTSTVGGAELAIKAAQDAANKIQDYFDLGLIGKKQAQNMLAQVNQVLKNANIDFEIKVHFKNNIDEFNEKMLTVADACAAPVNAIRGVKNALDSLNDVMEDPDADGWDQFFAVFDAGMAIINGVSTAMSILSTITDILTMAKQKNAVATASEAAAEQSATAVKAENATASITEAAAEGALAAAKGANSVASIPVVGWVLAIAAIAAIMAGVVGMISQAKGFATGGVVGGHSYTGDKILTRLNSGELILNQQQQQKLIKEMDKNVVIDDSYRSSINIPDKITLTAHGRDLQASLTNINKYNSKI